MALFLITAPSGSGKTSIMNHVAQYEDIDLGECISHTTRKMRQGEEDGVTYYYIHDYEFDNMKENNMFAETVVYSGNRYGISKDEIERASKIHEYIYIIVDYDGYKQVKDIYPNAIGIFLYADKEDCKENMLSRGDKNSNVEVRLSTYESEMMNRYAYDYVIKNVRGRFFATAHIIAGIVEQY